MLENFIAKHKIATVAAIIIVVIVVLVLSITSVLPKNTGTDGSSEATSTLPYSNDIYTISAVKDNVITIDAPEQYRNAAIQQLYKMNIDPTDYKVRFTYESPFKDYE